MKTMKLFLVIVLFTSIGITTSAQTGTKASGSKSESFKVWGNCDLCKARIEKAVKSEGATSADWNTKTKILTVTFDPVKTSVDAFSKKLAAVGHDTEKYKAADKVYNALDACCQYPRAK
jgi:mercuric ion binding protein